ncbi:hypothetical protein [Streptomyces sp. FxanaA7]|uniref:hypothetical protein n=1 Tax=Streptomyces sp. FxanaA7 TaxID=1265492 RepID=UPI0005ED8A0A|nr:hypothetical protein [Streptomyces sp. FxanaA7]
MPKKPKASEQDAKAAPAPELSAAPPAPSAQDAAGPTPQDADLDLNGETWSNFSEVDDELDELPER